MPGVEPQGPTSSPHLGRELARASTTWCGGQRTCTQGRANTFPTCNTEVTRAQVSVTGGRGYMFCQHR